MRQVVGSFLAEHPRFLRLPDGGAAAEELADDPALGELRRRLGEALGAADLESGRGSSSWRPGLVEAFVRAAFVACADGARCALSDWEAPADCAAS